MPYETNICIIKNKEKKYIFSSDVMKAVEQNIATICCWLGKYYAMSTVTLFQVVILMWYTSSATPILIYTMKC